MHFIKAFIHKDEDGFCAEGLDIDYLVYASSIKEVKTNFIKGMKQRILVKREENNTVPSVLYPARLEIWDRYYDMLCENHTYHSIEEIFPEKEEIYPLCLKKVCFIEKGKPRTKLKCEDMIDENVIDED